MMGVISFIIGMGLMRPLNRRLGENKILTGAIILFGVAYGVYPFMNTIKGFYVFHDTLGLWKQPVSARSQVKANTGS